MQTFLTRLTIFLAIQFVIAACLYLNSLNKSQLGFMAVIDDKLQMLEERDQPHLILIGGSNILFGIDSEQLQEQIGMPTINAGLHAGLGLLLFLDIAETYAQPGDVIVLIPEYPLLSSRLYPTDECSQELIRQSREGWKHLVRNPGFSLKEFVDDRGLPEIAFQLQSGMKYHSLEREIRDRDENSQPGVYSRLNFNEKGDFIGHHGQPQAETLRSIERRYYFFPSIYAKTTAAINECAAAVEAKGAKLFFAYSPIPEVVFDRSKNSIEQAHLYLTEQLDIPILHGPREVLYPESCFYDTSCHLNETTKRNRTSIIAQSLQRQFMVLSKSDNLRTKRR